MKTLISRLAASATLAVAVLAPTASAISAPFYQSYTVEADIDIRSIVMLQYTENGGGITNSFATVPPSSTITDPFLKLEPIVGTFLIGASFYGFDDEGDHLVLGVSNQLASELIGEDFSFLFGDFDEFSLISALDLLASPDTEDNLDDKEAAYGLLGGFSDRVRLEGGAFGSTDSFTLVGFSVGSQIGTGQASITSAAIPEPATWALLITGFGAAGVMLRRRRFGPVAAA